MLIATGQVGTREADEYEAMFINSLKQACVRMEKVRTIPGLTGKAPNVFVLSAY